MREYLQDGQEQIGFIVELMTTEKMCQSFVNINNNVTEDNNTMISSASCRLEKISGKVNEIFFTAHHHCRFTGTLICGLWINRNRFNKASRL